MMTSTTYDDNDRESVFQWVVIFRMVALGSHPVTDCDHTTQQGVVVVGVCAENVGEEERFWQPNNVRFF
jgi:hypothetical protein